MERPAKERLIGAVVIVTVAWLLIPVFLDQRGAEDGATVARQLALPEPESNDGSAIRRETVTLNAPEQSPPVASSEPVVTALPVPGQGEAAAPDRDVEPAATDTAAEPPATAPEASAEPDTAGSGGAPEDGAAEAKRATPAAEASPTVDAGADDTAAASDTAAAVAGDGQLWAVQLGSFSDRDNAQRLAGQLREQGLPAFLSEVEAGGRTLHRVRIGPQASRDAAETVAGRLVAAGQTARVVRHP